MTANEQLIAWLNNAYSMEKALIPVLENHAKDAENYPEVRERDLQHAEETRRQAERLEGCIKELGGSVSSVQSAIGGITGMMQSVSTGIFRDELVKNFIMDYAAEHFEIAAYKSLIATAQAIGEQRIIPVLQENLREEEAMAQWIEERLAQMTQQFIAQKNTASAA